MRWVMLRVMLAVALWAPSAHGEVAFDNASQRSGNANTITLDHTIGAGPNRFLVVTVAVEGSARLINGVGFDGADVTSFGAVDSPNDGCGIELLGVASPPTGSHQITVRLANRTPAWVFAVSYTGVDLRDPSGPHVIDFGAGSTTALAVPSARGDVVVDQVCVGRANNLVPPMPGAGQTGRAAAAAGNAGAGMSDRPGAPTASMSWQATGGGSPEWAAAAISLHALDPPSPDAGPDAPPDVSPPAPDAPGVDAVVPDAGPRDASRESAPANVQDAAAPDEMPSDDARSAVATLSVGCACRMGSRSRPSAPLLIVTLAALGARRRSARAGQAPRSRPSCAARRRRGRASR
jgi:hypothetical protein